MRTLFSSLLLCSLLILQGCADLQIPNPFEDSSASASDTYYDQFPDMPIPRDMTVDTKRTLVSIAQDGTKMGLLTVEGRVDRPSLGNAMIVNMRNQGWNLRGSVNGAKSMQLYEKNQRYAVIYIYNQTTSVAMELWVVPRLSDGVLPPSGGHDLNAPGSAPSFYLSPEPAAQGDVVQQEGLIQ